MQPDVWQPAQYNLFERERKQPGLDLIGLVRPRPNLRAVDLGCGTGALTRELHHRLPNATTVGIDSSEQMLAQAMPLANASLRFERGDISTYQPTTALDLIFSNAALQWVPDHAALLKRFAQWLAPAGQLAIQLPAMDDDPLHTAVEAVASEEPFRTALSGFVQHLEVQRPEWYATHLHALGFREQHVSLRVYGHLLPARDAAVEWMKGTMLTAYQRRLTPELYAQFLQRYREVLVPQLGDKDPYFLPYRRILMWAQK